MNLIKPIIFDYIDYRQYLDSIYKFHKEQNNSYSYRFIALQAGASSAGWFPNIIKGRINLTGTYIVKLVTLFKLSNVEGEYFEALVAYNQAASVEDRNFYLNKIKSIRGVKPAIVQREQFALYTKWYLTAIRELLLIHPLKNNYEKLANLLIPSITEDEAKEAIDILKMTSFIKEDIHGDLKPSEPMIKKDPHAKTDLWPNYMKSKIKLSLNAIDQFKKEERDISEVFMPLSEESLLKAKEEIAQLRKKLLVLSDNDSKCDRIYQCNVQLFPLTHKVRT
jgi:uncharacterized protein (TIGR02147 family)